MKKISVICSTYNSSKWITNYIETLNNQLLPSFEVVFVDAHSDDGSLDTIKQSLFRKGIEIQVKECSTRLSVTDTMNIGVKECNGEYIVLYNTDDFLFPSALLTYEQYASKLPDVDLFYSNFFIHKSFFPFVISNVRVWPEHSHETLLRFCYGGPFPCIKRKPIQDAGYFNSKYSSSADYDMWLNLSKRGHHFYKINEAIGSFCLRENSISNINLTLAQEEDREIQETYR